MGLLFSDNSLGGQIFGFKSKWRAKKTLHEDILLRKRNFFWSFFPPKNPFTGISETLGGQKNAHRH
jgi:hypothetical protein